MGLACCWAAVSESLRFAYISGSLVSSTLMYSRALCAPRPVLFSAAEGDQWANPAGQFQVLQAADPVYRFLGTEGLAAKQFPPPRQLVDSRLGFYIREGKHSMGPEDWNVFMNFADSQWRK